MPDLFQSTNFQEGKVLLIDKELNWTSFDAVNKIRILLKNKLGIKKIKVGHAGTLDPLATGLIIVCTGKATKQISRFQDLEKEYIAELKLGETTPSFDLESDVDKTFPFEHIDRQMLEEVLKRFIGEIDQVPPLFSAKYINGTRAYEYARKGSDMELKSQKIKINSIELIFFELPFVKLRINCSKGTYIRALARDIGQALNSGAYLSELRRTGIGKYSVNDAIRMEDFEKSLSIIET
ncbi:MAG: tRNA pseudouridine(55) synthase TruB [Bacteroidales bacterium]|nr:tRNA pseudouridine(55) synthase TruB [Bacteroidales bacterium]MCB8998720.1 tRNA pseudouridine(55) synthase TruB [Bacteroidales bacterium]